MVFYTLTLLLLFSPLRILHDVFMLLYIECPTRYRTRHWRYCNEIWTRVRSLCEKWRGMCL